MIAEGLVSDDQALAADIERSMEYQAELCNAVSEIAYNIAVFNQTQLATASQSAAPPATPAVILDPQPRGARHKLLEVDVIKFKGDPAQWDEFWDDFMATVDNKTQYTKQEKLKILQGSLEGEARGMVQNLSLTEANYEQAKQALEGRYANKQMRRFAHFEALLAVPPSEHSTSKLRNMFDQCEAHIRSLVGLGLDEDKFGEVFVPIILSKLPKFVRMDVTRKNGKKDWTLDNLRTLLREEIDIRDTCERTAWGTQETSHGAKHKGQKGKRESTPTASALVVAGDKTKGQPQCAFCHKQHESHTCRTYPDADSRYANVGRVCYACLKPGHLRIRCRPKVPCLHCNKEGHHKSLCKTKYPSKDNTSSSPQDVSVQVVNCQTADDVNSAEASALGVMASTKREGRAILETAVVKIQGTNGETEARVIFDCASTLSFITTALANRIGAKMIGEEVSAVGRFRDRKRCTSTYRLYELNVKVADGSCKRIVVNGVETISTPVQLVPLAAEHLGLLTSLTLAEPVAKSPKTVEIDILLGLDWYHSFVEDAQIRLTNDLVMKKSSFGWFASGFQRGTSRGSDHTHVILKVDDRKVETFDVERFWALDEIGIRDDPGVVDDEVALQYFKDTIKFDDGRYHVKWPFKDPNPPLPDNKGVALRRLKSLWSKLKGQPATLSAYDQVIQDQLQKGIIEPAPGKPDGLVHYLPHHGVVKEASATTKLRIVYDASAKKSRDSPSLNECLYRGPVLMCDLVGILLRARLHPIGLLADIEKAYLQVGLQLEDRDVTRFFWFRDPAKGPLPGNTVCFRFCRVIFGVRPSAFMLSGTVMVHVRKSDKLVARELENNMYVDNAFKGKSDLASAIQFYHDAKGLLAEASMNLREWYSNSSEVMQAIPEHDRGKGDVTQLLGVKWNVKTDELSSQPKLQGTQQPITKRQVLKTIATVYDPCGWFCPVVMPGKILMQDLWLRKCEWDQPIPDELHAQWNVVWQTIQQIGEFRIPRCIDHRCSDTDAAIELHTFCDASAKAYAACTYIRVSKTDKTTSNLVFAKCRVCPVKQSGAKTATIPRLELIAVMVGVRIQAFVSKELPLSIKRRVVWSDSKCVLHWIGSQAVQTKFVENRLNEIRRELSVGEFRYVPTSDNPADIPTRGMDSEELKSDSLWWQGPAWLTESDEAWPANIDRSEGADTAKNTEDTPEVVATVSDLEPVMIDVVRFSTLTRLLRVTAWVFRAVERFKGRKSSAPTITADETERAEQFWIGRVQRESIPEFFARKSGKDARSVEWRLGLHTDAKGIVRCRGRFENANLASGEKNPIFLPRHHRFTDLVVKRAHAKVLHSGGGNTLAEVRSKFWVPQGRAKVKQVIRRCELCRRFGGGHFQVPDPPALPLERVLQTPPFSVVGVDYAGPLFVKTTEHNSKVWIALFTCAVVRAIHLEVVESLSAYDFLLALRRFVATRGAPTLIISDNAKQFILSSQIFAKSWAQLARHDTVADYCAETGIEWKFVPETAAWMGGFYERLVKPVKEALKKCLGLRSVTLKELSTLVIEVSAMVNSRPLTYLESDVGDRPLRPLDFLRMNEATLVPAPQAIFALGRRPTAKELVELWEKCQGQLNRCWQQWRSRYLLSLREQT